MSTIQELTERYLTHAEEYYRTNPGEIWHLRACVAAVLKTADGDAHPDSFSPALLKRIRESLVAGGWELPSGELARPLCRTYCNAQIRRIIRIWKFGCEEGIVNPNTIVALTCVTALKKGRSACKEGKGKVLPVSDDQVEKILPYLGTILQDMVQLQMVTGMRSGEICKMRPCDLRMHNDLWIYTPISHKGSYIDKSKIVVLGPKAIEIVRRNLGLSMEDRLFHYSTASYRTAIYRACDRAGIPHWHPHMCRHAAATKVREEFGLEAAQVMMGHATLNQAEVYAEKSLKLASEVARRIG